MTVRIHDTLTRLRGGGPGSTELQRRWAHDQTETLDVIPLNVN